MLKKHVCDTGRLLSGSGRFRRSMQCFRLNSDSLMGRRDLPHTNRR